MPAVLDALQYEWVRIRTVRSTWVLTVLALVLTGLIGTVIASQAASDAPRGALTEALTAVTIFTPLLVGLIGAFAFGHEYRYGVIRPTLTAVPQRSALALAKILVVLGWSLVLSLLCVAVTWVLAMIFGSSGYQDFSITASPVPRVLVGGVIYTVLWALFGLAYGGLFRNIPAAVTLLLVVPLVAESLVRLLLGIDFFESIRDIGEYLPFTAGAQLYVFNPASVPEGTPDAFITDLTPLVGGLTMAAWAAALIALTWVLFEKRDA